MLLITLVIFAGAAIFGLFNLAAILRNVPTPKTAVVFHGIFAATGLLLLIIYTINNPEAPVLSLLLFIGAALGGFYLLTRDLSGKPGPKGLAILHASIAVTAFLILLFFII